MPSATVKALSSAGHKSGTTLPDQLHPVLHSCRRCPPANASRPPTLSPPPRGSPFAMLDSQQPSLHPHQSPLLPLLLPRRGGAIPAVKIWIKSLPPDSVLISWCLVASVRPHMYQEKDSWRARTGVNGDSADYVGIVHRREFDTRVSHPNPSGGYTNSWRAMFLIPTYQDKVSWRPHLIHGKKYVGTV